MWTWHGRDEVIQRDGRDTECAVVVRPGAPACARARLRLRVRLCLCLCSRAWRQRPILRLYVCACARARARVCLCECVGERECVRVCVLVWTSVCVCARARLDLVAVAAVDVDADEEADHHLALPAGTPARPRHRDKVTRTRPWPSAFDQFADQFWRGRTGAQDQAQRPRLRDSARTQRRRGENGNSGGVRVGTIERVRKGPGTCEREREGGYLKPRGREGGYVKAGAWQPGRGRGDTSESVGRGCAP